VEKSQECYFNGSPSAWKHKEDCVSMYVCRGNVSPNEITLRAVLGILTFSTLLLLFSSVSCRVERHECWLIGGRPVPTHETEGRNARLLRD
jgi:hypothetical protein